MEPYRLVCKAIASSSTPQKVLTREEFDILYVNTDAFIQTIK